MNRKREEVIAKLKELIKTKMYSKGSKLPSERDLSKTLGVSRILLREAIITLEAWGILETIERQGIYVVTPTISDFTEKLQFMLFWLEDLLPQVMEMRWILYVSAAELAAFRRTDEDLIKLQTCFNKFKSGSCGTSTQKKESARWEITLHNLYIATTHNTILERINEGVESLIERNFTLSNMIVMDVVNLFNEVVAHHEALIQAIEEKNTHKAKAVMIQHLGKSVLRVMKQKENGNHPFSSEI